VPHGIDAAMNAVKTTGLDATAVAATVNPRRLQLREADHAMLAGGEPRNELVRWLLRTFCTHVGA
jgi:hypothetical protein